MLPPWPGLCAPQFTSSPPTAWRGWLAPRRWMSSEEHGNGAEWLADSPGASRSRWWMETEAETIETNWPSFHRCASSFRRSLMTVVFPSQPRAFVPVTEPEWDFVLPTRPILSALILGCCFSSPVRNDWQASAILSLMVRSVKCDETVFIHPEVCMCNDQCVAC